jgi:hypothetical protein
MFYNSRKLKSPNATYSDDHIDGTMANPLTGYFTSKNIELANDDDNSNVLELFNDVSGVKVTLKDRTFIHDGDWNTLCLPFSCGKTGPLAGATIMELDTETDYSGHKTGFDAENGILYLYFKTADAIVANKPYIVKWADGTANNVTGPEFEDVTISGAGVSSVTSEDTKVTFKGTYGWQEFTTENKSILLLGDNNSLYYPQPSGGNKPSIGACRAYFELTSGQQARQFVLNFGDEETTGVVDLRCKMEDVRSDGWYSLDGRKLGVEPTMKGVYINNGRKVIVK